MCWSIEIFPIFVANIRSNYIVMENLTKEKFEIFMMLCGSGVDGNISMSELERILMQFDENTYREVFEYFKTLTSPDWLSFFKLHKDEFLKTEEDKAAFLADMNDLVLADGVNAKKEQNFIKVLEMLINDEL